MYLNALEDKRTGGQGDGVTRGIFLYHDLGKETGFLGKIVDLKSEIAASNPVSRNAHV
jgi:hypothetical protein